MIARVIPLRAERPWHRRRSVLRRYARTWLAVAACFAAMPAAYALLDGLRVLPPAFRDGPWPLEALGVVLALAVGRNAFAQRASALRAAAVIAGVIALGVFARGAQQRLP